LTADSFAAGSVGFAGSSAAAPEPAAFAASTFPGSAGDGDVAAVPPEPGAASPLNPIATTTAIAPATATPSPAMIGHRGRPAARITIVRWALTRLRAPAEALFGIAA
jgi:hypothetical protein